MTERLTQPPAVLIVDDNPLIVNVIQSLLVAEMYDVFVSTNGEEALGVLGKTPIDVIISDVMMPKMGGYELHQLVRQKPELSHIPFIFLSALSDDAEVQHGHEVGADDYLVKPFDPKMLLTVVRGKVVRSRSMKSLNDTRYETYRKKVIHTLSHEFRTPLVAINTGTEMLLEHVESLDKNKMTSLIQAIHRGGQRLEGLVNDFMVLQQLEAGVAQRLVETRASVMTGISLIEKFMLRHRDIFEHDQISVSVENKTEQEAVKVYEPHLIDIIRRLSENAIKFRGKDNAVELAALLRAGQVVIEIRDRGMGIDVSRIHEAINAFGQLDRDKLEQQGSGLGLAIASRYAALNGGQLEFSQREGGGSIAAIILPMQV